MTYNNRVAALRRRLRELGSAVVAFSGGVDSAVLTVIARQELKDRMCAATAVSPSIPSRDRMIAIGFCREHKIPHVLVDTKEFDDENYTANPKDRCFYCKQALYKTLTELTKAKEYRFIAEGTNASDLNGHRPGYKASLNRNNVATPLIDAGLTKEDVRKLARELRLSVADKPSSACLSSRIPQGTALNARLLQKIDDAEETIRSFGLSQVRVRHHEDLARVEIMPDEFTLFLKHREKITEALQKIGYKFVALDAAGYRTGGAQG